MKALIDAGFSDRLCPSHDGIVLSVVGGGNFEHAEAERLEYNPHGFLYLNKVVLPELREMGVLPGDASRACSWTSPAASSKVS